MVGEPDTKSVKFDDELLEEETVNTATAFDKEVWPKLEDDMQQTVDQLQAHLGVMTVQSEPDYTVPTSPEA